MSRFPQYRPAAAKLNGSAKPAPRARDVDALESSVVKFALGGKLAKVSRNAVNKQVQRGLPITFKRGNKVIKQFADGREEVLGTIKKLHFRLPSNVRIIGKE